MNTQLINKAIIRRRTFRILRTVVLIISIPGILLFFFSLFGQDIQNGQVAATVFIVLGLFCWLAVLVSFLSIRSLKDSREALMVSDSIQARKMDIKNWFSSGDFRINKVEHAIFQINSITNGLGEFIGNYSNGVSLYKFAVTDSSGYCGDLRDAFANFSDNTSTQTYIGSSTTRGQITQNHSNPERFDIRASTQNNTSTRRTGLAYVLVEGPNLVSRTFSFQDPGEAMNCSNALNNLSDAYQYNFESSDDDLNNWNLALAEAEAQLQAFESQSPEIVAFMRRFNEEILFQEVNRGDVKMLIGPGWMPNRALLKYLYQ